MVKWNIWPFFTEVSLKLLIFCWFVYSLAGASTEPLPHKLSFYHTNFNTSSEYHAQSLDLDSSFIKGFVSADARFTEGIVSRRDFRSKRFALGHKFTNWASMPTLRIGVLERDFEGDKVSVPVATLRGENTLYDKLYFTYSFGYSPMSEEFQTLYTVQEILRGSHAIVGGSYRLHEKWRTTFYFQHYFFNDDNTRMNHDLALFYGIAPGDPWIWVGFGASRMKNSATDRPYWVPLEFYNIGPRLDVSFKILEKLRFVGGINFNYFNDVRSGDGTGYYSNTRLLYKFSESLEFFSGLESIQSQQSGNVWKSSAVSIGLTGTF